MQNPNRCVNCIKGDHPGYDVADTGICGHCGQVSEVWDLDLIAVYRKAGISDEKICSEFPRLRVYPPI